MDFNFTITKDRLTLLGNKNGFSGNKNYYSCKFSFSEDWSDLTSYAVFNCGPDYYGPVIIKNGSCKIPTEALKKAGSLYVGVYGVKTDNAVCISTSWQEIVIGEGSFKEDITTPSEPSPELWQQYISEVQEAINNVVPKVGENDNWYVYNVETGEYTDSGITACGHTHSNISTLNAISENNITNWNSKQDALFAGRGISISDNEVSFKDYSMLLNTTITQTGVFTVELTDAQYDFSELSKIIILLKAPISNESSNLRICINGSTNLCTLDLFVSKNSPMNGIIRLFRDYAWWGIGAATRNDQPNAEIPIYTNVKNDIIQQEIQTLKIISAIQFPLGTVIKVLGA